MLNPKDVVNRKVSFGLFTILMGALAFIVSSPQAQGPNLDQTSTVEFSSVTDECDYARKIDEAGTSITCNAHQAATVNSKEVNGTVTVEVVEQEVVHRLTNPQAAATKERYLKVTLETATECAECADGKRKSTSIFNQEITQLGTLNQLIKAKFIEDAKRLAAESADAKKLALQREQCLIDESNVKIEATERLNCRMERLADMSDEKAAAYYEKYIRPELEGLVESDNVQDQGKAARLLAKLGQESSLGGKFVQQSIGDLKKFQQYRAQALDAKNNIQNLAVNDPRRAAMVQRFQQGEATARAYFKNRGLKIPNEHWPESTSFDYSGALGSDLERYRAQLDQDFQTYDQIINQHRERVGANGLMPNTNGDPSGRTARGQVATAPQQGPPPPFPPQNPNVPGNGQPRIR